MRLIILTVSGLSRFRVGGRVFVCSDLNENTASTAPAAPKRWPIADLFELINKFFFDPNSFSTAESSTVSPTWVDVP